MRIVAFIEYAQQKYLLSISLSILEYTLVAALFVLTFLLCSLVIFYRRKTLKLENKIVVLSGQNKSKNKFFSILAHDLKSPFNTLLGFSELLLLQAEDNKVNEVIDSSKLIHRSTKKLYTLVDTLLQWSRTQLGTTEYRPEVLEIDVELNNMLSVLRITAQEKDIVLTCKTESSLQAWADKDLLSTVVRNLITNAIKFSAVGSTIKVEAIQKKEYIFVSVIDRGIGMTKESIEKLFLLHHEVNETKPGTLDERGTGLGLILCKEFVELNKGQIFAESKLDSGTKITFSVPVFQK